MFHLVAAGVIHSTRVGCSPVLYALAYGSRSNLESVPIVKWNRTGQQQLHITADGGGQLFVLLGVLLVLLESSLLLYLSVVAMNLGDLRRRLVGLG